MFLCLECQSTSRHFTVNVKTLCTYVSSSNIKCHYPCICRLPTRRCSFSGRLTWPAPSSARTPATPCQDPEPGPTPGQCQLRHLISVFHSLLIFVSLICVNPTGSLTFTLLLSNKLYFISNFVKAQIFGQIEPTVNTVNTANTANTSNTANAANTTIR